MEQQVSLQEYELYLSITIFMKIALPNAAYHGQLANKSVVDDHV